MPHRPLTAASARVAHSARAPAGLEIGHRAPVRERLQGRLGSAPAEGGAGVRVGGGQQPCDELAATQDARICCGRRPGLPQGADRVEVNVPHKFKEIRLLLDHDGPAPVLEEVAHAVVPPVEGANVAGEEGAHAPGKGPRPGAHQEVSVIGGRVQA